MPRCVLPLLAIIIACTSCQLTLRTEVKRSRGAAAVAIRDNVSDLQKWGTKHYTLEFLRGAYQHTDYIVEGEHRERARFLRALTGALVSYEHVDIFLLAHSNRYVDWVAALDPALRARIRLVYNTGCGDASQGEEWMKLGAKAYVAHPGNNIAPIFYYYFLPEWSRGVALDEAVGFANRETREELLEGVAGLVIEAAGDDPAEVWVATEARIFGDRALNLRAATSK